MTAHSHPIRGSSRLPSIEHASVADVMHPGVVSCPPDTDLVTVARMMVGHHIHAVIVSGIERDHHGERLAWGLLSDQDLVAARARATYTTAGEVAAGDVVTVVADEPLERAAEVMVARHVSHLIVLSAPAGLPVGIVSTLDVAGAIAWGEA